MKKFLLSNWALVLVVALSLATTWPVFVPGYFSHHDDLQVMRIFEMRKCFADLQIPCRWVPDMGYGNGYPIFNFYGVFPYYLGAIASYILGYIGAAKFLFFLPLILGGVGMYLLAKELFGRVPGLVGAALYIFAPYRALDSYVRGAVGESFALGVIPFVFYFGYKKNFFGLALTLFIFLTSHNIMTLIFTPFIIAWILFCPPAGRAGLYKEKWKGTKRVITSLALGFGLASFFILPAFFEKNLVQTESLVRAELDFRAQFVKVSQLFTDRSWNYAGSAPQSTDTISYQIGWPHWWLAVLAIAAGFAVKNKKRLLGSLLFLAFAFGIFMTHNKSAPIWEAVKILSFVQFPWRFLSIAIFFGSLLGAYFVAFFKGKRLLTISFLIVALAGLLNWRYFRPEHFYYGLTDREKLSGQNFIDQQKGALLDYLPKGALEPRELAPSIPLVVLGKAKIQDFVKKSGGWSFKANVQEKASIEVPVFDFAGWRVNYPYKAGTIGRITVDLPVGEHEVVGKFGNTPIRTFGNAVSVLSFVFLVLVIKNGKIRKVLG